jgi:alanine racemase
VDLEGARAYAEAAREPCEVFVKIDVGLERLGVLPEGAVKLVTAMQELPHLRLGGLCAHPHAPAGSDPAYADWQLGRFTPVVDELEARGIRVPVRLLASSPYVLRYPQSYLNAVDPGRMLYASTCRTSRRRSRCSRRCARSARASSR